MNMQKVTFDADLYKIVPIYDDKHLDKTCGGMGVLYCHCGGDLCVCHNHGEVECFGCEDCKDENY